MLRRPVALAACALAGAPAAPALAAGDPILPLDQVHAGMACTGASVVQGTAIATFDVHVDDVLPGGGDPRDARILVTVSGAAVDATGVGPGFSGSPITCVGADGTPRIIGAISETIGSYAGKTVLATPIQAVIGEPVDPPQAKASARAAAVLRAALPIAEPLSLSGLAPGIGAVLQRAARRAGREVFLAPAAGPAATAPALRPGSAMAAALVSGDLDAGAIGTVAYVDGDAVWGFGHPFDGAGRRGLFLTPAYVFAVVNNPAATQEVSTYKLATPLDPVGTLTQDGVSAVAGRLGAGPVSYPLSVTALDTDTGRTDALHARVADERALGYPSGSSALTTVLPGALAQAMYGAFGGTPSRQSANMCVRISVRGRPKPLGFCNTYVSGGSAGFDGLVAGPVVADAAAASGLVDLYDAGPLTVTGVDIGVRVRRGMQIATLEDLSGPRTARRGRTIRVIATLLRPGGARLAKTIRVRVPRGMPRGTRDLLLRGTAADVAVGSEDDGAAIDLTSLFEPSGQEQPGPKSLGELADALRSLHRYDGVRARFVPPGANAPQNLPDGAEGVAQRGRRVFRDANLRVDGRARLPIVIR